MNDWKWFRHRIGSDPKLSKLIRQFGTDGYAVYFKALEYIYDGGLGQSEVDEIAIIFNLQISQVTNILKYASDCCYGLLIYNKEDGTWTSRKAVELMEEDEKTRQSHRDRQKRYMNKRDSQMTVDDSHVTVSNSQMTPKNKKEREKDIRRDLDKREKNKQKESDDSFGSLPPKKEAVEAYMHSIGKTFDVDRFMDYYSSIGWKLKGEPIADVEALIRRWPDDHITHNVENHPEYREIEESSRRTL